MKSLLVTFALALLSSVAAMLPAAEIQLRTGCKTEGGLVLLGDLADVFAQDDAEVQKLAAIDLVPAPPAGEKRVLRLREIRDLLVLRGVNLAQHRFSGASQVTVQGIIDLPKPVAQSAPVAAPVKPRPVAVRLTTETIRRNIGRYLADQDPASKDATLNISVSDDAATIVSAWNQAFTVSGGESPWTGEQVFTLTPQNGGIDAI